MAGLAIFAGRGALPAELATKRPDALIVTFDGVDLDFVPDNSFKAQFEKSGSLFKTLRKSNIEHICFAGAISRPVFNKWRLDFKTLTLMPKLKTALESSDGNALKFIRNLVESEGFQVVSPIDIEPNLLAGSGYLSENKALDVDISRALEVHEKMSEADIGQALVIRDGQVLAIETLPGTKAMLEFCAAQSGEGGFLYKASKRGQDLAMDMASIGPDTISQLSDAKLQGVILGASNTMILERDKTIQRANELGISIRGV